MFYLKTILGSLLLAIAWAGLYLYGTFSGWFQQAVAPAGDTPAFYTAATNRIKEAQPGALALVMIEAGDVVDAYYGGVGDEIIDADTLFATASMSKWLTAWGVMVLVREGRLDLDRPIADYLTRWQLPDSGFDGSGVTARRLLSHTAGLTDGLGFGDYTAGETVPDITESLRNPRASGDRVANIVIGVPPGAEFNYSGGGYLILQLAIEEISGQPFDRFMQSRVFDPAGMTRSTYADIGTLPNHAFSFDTTGSKLPHFRYAAAGATGLAASTADLTRFVRLQLAESNPVLPQPLLQAMRTPEAQLYGVDLWGLGTILYAPTAGGDFIYGHDGQNDPAINAAVRINPTTRDAIIVLVSGQPNLATRIGSDWVFWQAGVPDVLTTGSLLTGAINPIGAGCGVIFLLAGIFAWRYRPRRQTRVR